MGDKNPICTLGDYSKPSHEGYMNTIKLLVGNNVVPLRSDTIPVGPAKRTMLIPRTSLAIGLNDFQQDPSPHGRILVLVSLLNSFTRETANLLLKELTTSRAPKKVLIREEAKFLVTKNVNSIYLTRGEEERSKKTDVMTGDDIEKPTKTEMKMPVKEAEKEDEAENEPNKKAGKEETTEEPSSQPVKYYLKHRINEKLIEGIMDNHMFNDSLLGARVKKIKGKTYNLSHRGPIYEAILRKKITRKEDIKGNFEIPSEDVLVKVAEHVYPMDFVILDIKEDKKRPFILGTPFLTMAKAVIKFYKGTITLRLVLEWEERIKLHLEREMEFDQWKSKIFKGKHPALVKVEGGMDDEGEVT
ncbi:zinc finger, CCHC-type containing protein [Tanacetum coccineum]